METVLKPNWQVYKISSDETHHLIDGYPVYKNRFIHVLKFHHPGLAPVLDKTGAYHIDPIGQPIYSQRYTRTFGFYCGFAAINDKREWFHILSDGTPLYKNRYGWCGNFQENLCTVRDQSGTYFHIDIEGSRPYSQSYSYAGDFHDAVAVVQMEDGLHFHINPIGELLHPNGFLDLDVYHKGFARAKDSYGWFHINLSGCPVYQEKYAFIEPFYNGVSRVETKFGEILLIDEQGQVIKQIRAATQDAFHDVSGDLVSYWRLFTLKAAQDLNLFNELPGTISAIGHKIGLAPAMTEKILLALKEMHYVSQLKEEWKLTNTGEFLTSSHPYSIRDAQNLWMMEHYSSWHKLPYSLKNGRCAFEKCFQEKWFDFLAKDPEKQELYHQALSQYAKRDYANLAAKIDFSTYHTIADIGGSEGTVLKMLISKNPHLTGHLIDLPTVIDQITLPKSLRKKIFLYSCDFFKTWPQLKVDVAILCRVIHDWPNDEALHILKRARALLKNTSSRLLVIENILDKETGNGALLNLNMLVMTGGQERTFHDFTHLFKKAGFSVEKTVSLNTVSSILVLKPLK